jgi:D-glycero-D-manno-heptose 1,7-bisphosphate phosphatase
VSGGRGAPRRAVFLDRDGTVIHDRHYLGDPAGVELLPTAGAAIARLNAAGVPVILITNQSGIGRGLFTEAQFEAVQARIAELLAEQGARLDAVYHCPHGPDLDPPCACRKPKPGLFLQAARDFGVDPDRCFYVGDRGRDLAAVLHLGGTPILVRAGAAADAPREALPPTTRTVDTLDQAVRLVLAEAGPD